MNIPQLAKLFVTLMTGVWASVKADGLSTPGKIDCECYDIAQLWARMVGAPRFTTQYAYQIFDNPGNNWEAIANTPTNQPIAGDLVVLGNNYNNSGGHVVLATGNNTNTEQFEAASQNDPDGSETEVKIFKYTNAQGQFIVRGWLRPKNV